MAAVALNFSGGGEGRSSTGVAASERGATTSTPASTSTTLPRFASYAVLPGEPAAELKERASDVVQALATYGVGEGTPAAAHDRLTALGESPEIAQDAGPLLRPTEAASAEIIYPQLGGLTEAAASVMVVVRQHFASGPVSRTVDVRLVRGESGWRVERVASIGDVSTGSSAVATATATAALASPNLEFPDSARVDIERGSVDERLLRLLVRLSEDRRFSITTLIAGHPAEVFGTNRRSNHTAGRAVDIWAIDGVPVVRLRDDPQTTQELLGQLLAEGVPEIGSPWDLDGPGSSASFTNEVHQDHIHLAFDA